ncbi:MAG: hypothetical protein MRY79_05975 [Alphaproteobacteria bacterium]|nr:hypothetical protein [Alphaproteobacteria bacterium]
MKRNLPTQVKSIDVAQLVEGWMQRPDNMDQLYHCQNAQFYDALCHAATIFCFAKRRIDATDKVSPAYEFEFYGFSGKGYKDLLQDLKNAYTKLQNLRDGHENIYGAENASRVIRKFEKFFKKEIELLKGLKPNQTVSSKIESHPNGKSMAHTL